MKNEIKNFLSTIQRFREIALIVVQNQTELEEAEEALVAENFSRSSGTREVFKAIQDEKKTYFVAEGFLGNNLYNILPQYSTGQVNVFDGKVNLVANPNYQKGALVVLVTEKNLHKIEQSNHSLLKIVGLTWRK